MGEHKTGVPERARKRKQKKMLTIACLVLSIIVLIVGICLGNRDNDDSHEIDVTSPTDATTEVTEPYVAPEAISKVPVKTGTVGEDGAIVDLPEWIEQNEFHVGDVMVDGNLSIVYMSSGEAVADDVAEGMKVVCFEFFVENKNTTDEEISFYNFRGYADGEPMNMYYGAEAISADLSPNRSTTGFIHLIVPVDAETIELCYITKDDAANDKSVTFVYEADKSAGYVISDVSESADVMYVSDVVEAGTYKVSYLSCKDYISEDPENQPAEGYKYIQCEFQIERIKEHHIIDVSAWDFACYADGMFCEIKHIGDNELNDTLHAGESTTGIVTFEVPIDAKIIEAEFMYDYYHHERLIFNIVPGAARDVVETEVVE